MTTASDTPFDVEIYLHGRCHIFALALHQALGYPIEFMWSESDFEDSDEPEDVLEHAYCLRPNGTLVDASGSTTMERITQEFSSYGCDPEGAERVSLKNVQHLMAEGRLAKPEPGEIAALVAHIKAHPGIYATPVYGP